MFIPRNEQGVVVLFAQLAESSGWEIVEIGASFPDAVVQKDGVIWNAEFEFMASNFVDHRHDHRKCDMIICWKNNYPKCPLPILEVSILDSFHARYIKTDPALKEIEYWKCRALRAEESARVESRQTKRQVVFATTAQRHDELLRTLIDISDPSTINKAELGRQHGVSRTQIDKDIRRLVADGRLNGAFKERYGA